MVPSNIRALFPDLELLFTALIGHPFPLFHPLVPFSKPELFNKFLVVEELLFFAIELYPTSTTDKSSNQLLPVAPATYFNNAIRAEVFSGPVLNVTVTSPYSDLLYLRVISSPP